MNRSIVDMDSSSVLKDPYGSPKWISLREPQNRNSTPSPGWGLPIHRGYGVVSEQRSGGIARIGRVVGCVFFVVSK